MKLNKPLFFNILLGILIASCLLFFSQKGYLKRLELPTLDFFFRLRGNIAYHPRINIIEITDSDIAQVGRWPWDRSWHAAMASALTGLGAKYIYFDFILSEASSEENDRLLEEAIRNSKKVYLPFTFQDTSFDLKNALLPLERFSRDIKGTGAINIYPDIDGIVRKMSLVFPKDKDLYLHAALRLPLDYLGLEIKEVHPRYILLANSKDRIKIPLIEKNTLLINWTGKWKDTFKHYGFLEVLAGYKDFLEHKNTRINPDNFKESICLVAISAIGLYDLKPIPLEPIYPGIGVTANVMSNILNKKFIFSSSEKINNFLLYFLTLLPAFLIVGTKPLRETLSVFLVGVGYLLLNFLLFKFGVYMEFAAPLVGLIFSGVTVGTYNFFRVALERQNFFRMAITDGLTNLYNIRYFRMLIETEIMMAKSDPTKIFTLVMSDVDHFKNFNDTYGHQVGDLVLKEVANALKVSVRYSDIVARYGGEEMIILLRGTLLKDGLIVAEKIRKNVEDNTVKDQRNTYKVTISLGVSTFRRWDDVDAIIKRADDGLYKAKQSGRNRVMTTEENPT